jgi:hypothetical protein
MHDRRRLTDSDIKDILWAHDMVAKGVKPVAVLAMYLRCDDSELEGYLEDIGSVAKGNRRITACYLDMLREPDRMGCEFTGGNLVRPVIGILPKDLGIRSVFFAANEVMADLCRWGFSLIMSGSEVEKNRGHALMGLLCGYSPLAIEGFFQQAG